MIYDLAALAILAKRLIVMNLAVKKCNYVLLCSCKWSAQKGLMRIISWHFTF